MSTDAVQKLEAALTDQPANPWRPPQTAGYQEERERLAKFVQAPAYVPGDRSAATSRLRQLDKMIAEQAPRRIEEPIRANQVHQLAKEVLETELRPALLPRSVMRRNPAGAVNHFQRQENSKAFKRSLRAWKRARWALDPDGPSDHTNIEIYRPEGEGPGGTATFMPDAQIPGNFAMSPQAKANWPLGEPTMKTALQEAIEREQASILEKEGKERQIAGLKAGKATQKKRVYTDAEKAAFGERMKKARAARMAAPEA